MHFIYILCFLLHLNRNGFFLNMIFVFIAVQQIKLENYRMQKVHFLPFSLN